MGQVIQTNGDYSIKTSSGSTITLDTGATGQVTVIGNLIVKEGAQTDVSVENLIVKDNIIVLNNGETGEGVTLTHAGVKVDRGQFSNVSLVWDENLNSWAFYSGNESALSINENSRLTLKEISTDTTINSGNLTLNTGNFGVVEVSDNINYQERVIEDYHIPNKKYVDTSIIENPNFQIRSSDSRVYIMDADVSGAIGKFFDDTGFVTEGDQSAVSVIVDGTLVSQTYADKTLFGQPGDFGIEIDGENYEIRTETSISNQNIFIKTAGTGKLQTNYAIQLDKISSALPGSVINTTLLYSQTPSTGTTGVWFVNDSSIPTHQRGELISKNRALLFSMLF